MLQYFKEGGEKELYDENQTVIVKWNNTNKEWYQSKGYTFTKRYDELKVLAKDLPEGSSAKVIVTCDYCGQEYLTQNDVLMKGRAILSKDCCPSCAGKKASDISRARRAHKYYAKLSESCDNFGYTLITTEEEYTGLHMIVKYICPIHGEKESIFANLMRGHGCLECSYSSRFDGMRHDQDYIEAVINNTNGNKWLNPGEYKTVTLRNLRIRCKCGKEYITSFGNFINHGVTQCFSCSCKESTGEAIVRKYLDNHNIEYIQEMRFSDCRDKKPLPFDFFLPNYNMCIEFDGKQHFEDCHGFSNLEVVKHHDKIKNQYCSDNNIKLIRVPYHQGHNINEILSDNLIV